MSNDHQMSNDHNLTTAMIVAGNDALSEYWLDLTEGRGLAAIPEVVSCIYLAMEKARNQGNHPQTLADAAS